MKTLFALGISAIAAAAQPVDALDRRVYAGREANAVKCAAYFSYVALVGEQLGVIPASTKQAGAEIGTYILVQHVSGSWQQKISAYNVVIERMPTSDLMLFESANRHLGWCRQQFLP